MSHLSVEEIKEAIDGLRHDEKVSLVAWLSLQTSDDWDRQMERDFSPGGRGRHVVDRVKSSIRAGEFRPMEQGRKPGT